MMYLLDTTAFSAAMRNEPAIVTFLQDRRPGEIAIAPPVEAEIEYGIKRLEQDSRKHRLLSKQKKKLLQAIGFLPWTNESSRLFGIIKTDLEHKGTPIDDFDVAIAAIALSHGAAVVTANLVHFSRVAGLESIHWISASERTGK